MSRFFQVLLVILGLLLVRFLGIPLPPLGPTPPANEHGQNPATAPETVDVFVKRVVDGDTLLLENGDRVRLLGIDTPETKKPDTPVAPFGPEASEFTRQLVEGRTVTLVFDRERFDKYRRILAFVYVDNICVNEEILRNGLSKAHLQYPYRSDMKTRFRAAEKEARERNLGIWSLPGNPQHVPTLQ